MRKIFTTLIVTILLMSLFASTASACIPSHVLWGTVTQKAITVTLDDGTKTTLRKGSIVKKTGWTWGNKVQIEIVANGGRRLTEDPLKGEKIYVKKANLKLKKVKLLQCKCLSR